MTVNKLTIGVTVKPWSAVFVLKDLASPESYFQSIFRIQTPNKGKTDGYVYDFNVDRAAALLLKFAEKSGENREGSATVKVQIAKTIVKFLPIYLNGNIDTPISEDVFYQLAEFGDTNGLALSAKITNTDLTTRIGDDETIAMMMADKEVKPIFEKVFAHAKFKKKKKDDHPIPQPPDDFDPEITKRARDLGYKAGLEDFSYYAGIYDDQIFSEEFMKKQDERAEEYCPDDLRDEKKYPLYKNAFVKGYAAGVNVDAKKLNCGREDGIAFVKNIREKFGNDIVWNKETAVQLKNYINTYLNDIENIPKDNRNAQFKRWYVESFTRAVKNELRPDKDGKTVGDAENVLRHILVRLFEFLYISVYRETTFDEIFSNADPNVFLEAVGIKKEEFTILNRYHIFEENMLNNCINDFFINESLGSKLDMNDEEVRKKYRNSFDWFGFGVED